MKRHTLKNLLSLILANVLLSGDPEYLGIVNPKTIIWDLGTGDVVYDVYSSNTIFFAVTR